MNNLIDKSEFCEQELNETPVNIYQHLQDEKEEANNKENINDEKVANLNIVSHVENQPLVIEVDQSTQEKQLGTKINSYINVVFAISLIFFSINIIIGLIMIIFGSFNDDASTSNALIVIGSIIIGIGAIVCGIVSIFILIVYYRYREHLFI